MNNQQFKELVSSMPPLPHSLPGEPFDIDRSEALRWIMAQPGAKEWVWNRIRNTGRIECGANKLWRGVKRRTYAERTTKPEPMTDIE